MSQNKAFQSEKARWEAVLGRDPAAHSAFVYAVRTTGVFCRPTCPSRKPRKENALLFDRPAQARRAGFRPCLRCLPEEDCGAARADPRVVVACRTLEEARERPSLADLAEEAGLSPFHFQRLFKKATGLSPNQYYQGLRRGRLQENLSQSATVTEALYEAGLGSGSRLYENYLPMLGMKPGDYKDGGRSSRISYALGRSSLGLFLVAATPRGLCRIDLGGTEEELVGRLKERFTKAQVGPGGERFQEIVDRVGELLDRPGKDLGLPLDIRGTAFQQKVWQALQAIPPGQTATYGQVAEELGRPGSARAVARACASNQLALAIPCHRVVRADGGLGGYRWGIRRKEAILKKEAGE